MRMLVLFITVAALAGCSQVGTYAPSHSSASSVASFPRVYVPLTEGNLHSTKSAEYASIYSFHGPPDGVQPLGNLVEINGTLYGTTTGGGQYGHGTVFSVSALGVENVLYSFQGTPDGASPNALMALNNTLYGVTSSGGTAGLGAVFSITTTGAESILYSFTGSPDGQTPYGALVELNGVLYGTTIAGGVGCTLSPFPCGTVFSLSTSGAERIIYSFKGPPDGAYPNGGLTIVGSSLYGTTQYGGPYNPPYSWGTVFKIGPTTGKEDVVYSFKGGTTDAQYPAAGLVAVNKTLYGTSEEGGSSQLGTVFKITARGKETMLHSFAGNSDGAYPQSSLLASKSQLYGVTTNGGTGPCDEGPAGCGVVFSLNKSGRERLLYAFHGHPDGQYPVADLILADGLLYGTTTAGGTYGDQGTGDGFGTVFTVKP